MTREIVFDTETTGMSPEDGHKIVEIGMLELEGRVPTGRTFHHYINPERDIEESAIRVHGITNDRVRESPVFADIAEDMMAFIGDAPLVAHNATFDMNFVNFELKLLERPTLTNEVIDTLEMAREIYPGARNSLDALCKRYEVDLTDRTLHGALLDARLLAEVYLHLTGGPQPDLGLGGDEYDQSKYRKAQPRPVRDFAPSADELSRHEAFVKAMPSTLWKVSAD